MKKPLSFCTVFHQTFTVLEKDVSKYISNQILNAFLDLLKSFVFVFFSRNISQVSFSVYEINMF